MAPTVLEFGLVALIFLFKFGLSYVAVTAVTVWFYIWFTIRASDWRIQIRRDMNNSDTEANTKAIDSLLNFETVKYFGNEEMEAKRFDKSIKALTTKNEKLAKKVIKKEVQLFIPDHRLRLFTLTNATAKNRTAAARPSRH